MDTCNANTTPLDVDLRFNLEDCLQNIDAELQCTFRKMVGSLMYLYQLTRHDIVYAVTFLQRNLHKQWQTRRETLGTGQEHAKISEMNTLAGLWYSLHQSYDQIVY